MSVHTPTCYTAIQFNSHPDPTIPRLWFDSQPFPCQWRLQFVPHDCVPVRITTENLKSETSKTFHTHLVEINRFFAGMPIARVDSSIIVTMMKIDYDNFGYVTFRRVGRVIVSLSRCFNSLFLCGEEPLILHVTRKIVINSEVKLELQLRAAAHFHDLCLRYQLVRSIVISCPSFYPEFILLVELFCKI